MNLKITTSTLCFLTKAKEDKRFYNKNKKDIDKLERLFNKEIDAFDSKPRSKFSFTAVKDYFTLIAALIHEYFNSS